jgi:DNA-binding SARP family transcriptional activator/TolB-like protein
MIEFRVLGSLDLKRSDGKSVTPPLTRPKWTALLTFLATASPKGFHRRDTLAALLWPELDQPHARHALRQVLYGLRQELGENIVEVRGDEEVALNAALVSCDAAAFADAVESGDVVKALELYRGDFLTGFHLSESPRFERWMEDERTRLKELAAGAAWALAHRHLDERRSVDAERTAQRALALVPTDESEVRRFIEAMADAGDRAAAVGFYQKFAGRLADDYEIEPAAETKALIEAVRSREPPSQLAREEPSSNQGPRRGPPDGYGSTRRRSTFAWVASVLAVFAAMIWVVFAERGTALDASRVVVAPFANLTGDSTLDAHGRAAADLIAIGLQEAGLSVVPTQAARFDGNASETTNPIRALAEATGAGIVIAGDYKLSGDSLFYRAELTDANRMEILFSVGPVGAPVAEPEGAFELLRARVLGALATRFDPYLSDVLSSSSAVPTFAAYVNYMEGSERRLRLEFREALGYYFAAYAIDSAFVQPLLWAALTYLNLRDYSAADSLVRVIARSRDLLSGHDRLWLDWLRAMLRGNRQAALETVRDLTAWAPQSMWEYEHGLDARSVNRPREAVEALERLDPERGWLAEWPAYWTYLTEALHMLGHHRRELREARRAREMFPAHLGVVDYELRALAALGRVDELFALLDESLTLPLTPDFSYAMRPVLAASELRAHGHLEAYRASMDRALTWFESHPVEGIPSGDRGFNEAQTLYWAERWPEAHSLLEMLVTEYPDRLDLLGSLGVTEARLGNREVALRISTDLASLDRPYLFGTHTRWRARIAAVLGDREDAVRLLREAFRDGLPYSIRLHRDIDFESLHDYPPFHDLLTPR